METDGGVAGSICSFIRLVIRLQAHPATVLNYSFSIRMAKASLTLMVEQETRAARMPGKRRSGRVFMMG